jgi:DNA-directed RNA polymerase subunit RPC12/RpoP
MNFGNNKSCTICGKPVEKILVLTEVSMHMHSCYRRQDGDWEYMNGLQKQTEEYFCEECFRLFVDRIVAFSAERQKQRPTD